MIQGTEAALAWFDRTQKKGWRLIQGNRVINEYFDAQSSQPVAQERLKIELEALMGGEYFIEAKDSLSPSDTKKILTQRLMLMPQGNQTAAMSGTMNPNQNTAMVPKGYYSQDEFDFRLKAQERDYEWRMRMDDMERKLAEKNEPEEKHWVGQIVDKLPMEQLIGMALQKWMGGPTVGITGPINQDNRHVPPAAHTTAARADTQTQPQDQQQAEPEEYTEEQDERITNTFNLLVALENGNVETALQLFEALPKFIIMNPQIFKFGLKGQLAAYIPVQVTEDHYNEAMKVLHT